MLTVLVRVSSNSNSVYQSCQPCFNHCVAQRVLCIATASIKYVVLNCCTALQQWLTCVAAVQSTAALYRVDIVLHVVLIVVTLLLLLLLVAQEHTLLQC
jgi:hypothetical protein